MSTDIILEAADVCGSIDTATLYSWSTNYDAGTGPFTLFLDLIGYSFDEYGEALYTLTEGSLGYVELGYLARALNEYTDNPTKVRDYVEALLSAELEDEDA